MNFCGLGLSLIVWTIVAGQIVAHKWIKKVTNSYFFWLAVGGLVTAWLIAFRFRFAWYNLATVDHQLDLTYYFDAFIFSKALLLDICPFCGLMLPILLVVDPTRYSARALAPMALIGGIWTMVADIPFDLNAYTMPRWTAEYIFFGVGDNHCYFILHALNLILAVGVMLNSPKYGCKGYLICVGTAILFYSYVGIMIGATGIRWFVSGLSYNDWGYVDGFHGEYSGVAELLHCSPITAACVGLPAMFAATSGFVALNDYVFNKWVWTYGNATSGKWHQWYDYKKFDHKKIW